MIFTVATLATTTGIEESKSPHFLQNQIVMESVAVKDLLETAPRPRARGIRDAGWSGCLHLLPYTCKEQGKRLWEVGRYVPSTKQCFNCKANHAIPLEQRDYRCRCGHRIHRDHQAALHVKAAGMSV